MAIDKNKTQDLLNGINSLFELIPMEPAVREFLKEKVMGKAIKEIKELIEDSRPPKMYLIGRSGHGKSSLINALANKEVARTGHTKPTSFQAEEYPISFEGKHATWKIIDSRGIFDSTPPEGAPFVDAVEQAKNDVLQRKPDVVIHVISAPEVRNLSNDIKVFQDVVKTIRQHTGKNLPVIIVFNKADTLDDPSDWPPETNEKRATLIKDSMVYMARDILGIQYKYIDRNIPFKGLMFEDAGYVSIVPVRTLKEKAWNIETLSWVIVKHLPQCAILDFVQAQGRQKLLKDISSSLIKKFAAIAGVVGLSPIPVSDIAILIPLQLLMIAIIGGLSCRSFEKETAAEYMTACGTSIGVGAGSRMAAQQLVKLFNFIPGVGSAISAAIAAGGTYTLGKGAEKYFFGKELKKPEDFKDDWERDKNEILG